MLTNFADDAKLEIPMSRMCERQKKCIKGLGESLEIWAGNNQMKFILKKCKSQHTVHLGSIYQINK